MRASVAPRVAVSPLGREEITVSDGLTFSERARKYASENVLPASAAMIILNWYDSYAECARQSMHTDGDPEEFADKIFTTLLELSRKHVETPPLFESYHKAVRSPFDHYKFSLNFVTILVNTAKSRVLGQENLRIAMEQVAAGENVVFLANHQSEGDPYAIDVMLDWVAHVDRDFIENMVFMAGDRVRDDPVVAPFSIGRNLLTVFSKKHINDIPELRSEKLKHNRRTIASTVALFNAGGAVLWFAPSGGRDRRSAETGRVEVSPLDPDAIDVMRMSAAKAKRKTHFYPMSLLTYDMLPPPEGVGGAELGEERKCSYAPMHMNIGEEIDWKAPDIVDASEGLDKVERRRVRRQFVEDRVKEGYTLIGGYEH